MKRNPYKRIAKNIYRINAFKPGSHSYLIIDEKNLLIDPGLCTRFSEKKKVITDLGLKEKDIDLVLLSHGHVDHSSSSSFLAKSSLICAHENALIDIESELTKIIMKKCRAKPFKLNMSLAHSSEINSGAYNLRVLHTPGHSSGSICFYETKKKIVFSGDTIFADGILPIITSTGSIREHIFSLEMLKELKIKKIMPGHGNNSYNAKKDIAKALKNSINSNAVL